MDSCVNRPKVNGFHHAAVLAPNLECALEFYGVLLGLRPLPLPEGLDGAVLWFDLGGGDQLHVIKGDPAPDGRAHVALDVNTAQEWRDYFIKHDHDFYEPDVQIAGKERIFTTDPFGNLIELTEAPERR